MNVAKKECIVEQFGIDLACSFLKLVINTMHQTYIPPEWDVEGWEGNGGVVFGKIM